MSREKDDTKTITKSKDYNVLSHDLLIFMQHLESKFTTIEEESEEKNIIKVPIYYFFLYTPWWKIILPAFGFHSTLSRMPQLLNSLLRQYRKYGNCKSYVFATTSHKLGWPCFLFIIRLSLILIFLLLSCLTS